MAAVASDADGSSTKEFSGSRRPSGSPPPRRAHAHSWFCSALVGVTPFRESRLQEAQPDRAPRQAGALSFIRNTLRYVTPARQKSMPISRRGPCIGSLPPFACSADALVHMAIAERCFGQPARRREFSTSPRRRFRAYPEHSLAISAASSCVVEAAQSAREGSWKHGNEIKGNPRACLLGGAGQGQVRPSFRLSRRGLVDAALPEGGRGRVAATGTGPRRGCRRAQFGSVARLVGKRSCSSACQAAGESGLKECEARRVGSAISATSSEADCAGVPDGGPR